MGLKLKAKQVLLKSNISFKVVFNPQTTVRGPMEPTQHSDSCKSEMENDLAEILYNLERKTPVLLSKLNGSKYFKER